MPPGWREYDRGKLTTQVGRPAAMPGAGLRTPPEACDHEANPASFRSDPTQSRKDEDQWGDVSIGFLETDLLQRNLAFRIAGSSQNGSNCTDYVRPIASAARLMQGP